jgi:hypothetical protein
MICYKDKTFCPYWGACKIHYLCDRPLTPEVEKAAEEWWGGTGAPICMYSEFPDCFIPFFDNGPEDDLGGENDNT